MPPAVVRRMFRAHLASPARTDLRSFPGRTHWLIAQEGWEEVAQACIDWIGSLGVTESWRGADEVGTSVDKRDKAHARRSNGRRNPKEENE